MASSPSLDSPTILDRISQTVLLAYSQSLECPPEVAMDDPLLRWCFDEIGDAHNPDQFDLAEAYVEASEAMENAIRSLRAIVKALDDQADRIHSTPYSTSSDNGPEQR